MISYFTDKILIFTKEEEEEKKNRLDNTRMTKTDWSYHFISNGVLLINA